jgi:hypothetical protein
MLIVTRRYVATAAAVVVGAVAVSGFGWTESASVVRPAAAAAVNPMVPEYRLLQDALDITLARRAGEPNFTYVPADRPPGLLRMFIAGDGTPITDGYEFGPQQLDAITTFSASPNDLCAIRKRGQVSGLCVRDGAVTPAPPDPALRHLVVHFAGNINATPSTRDVTTAAALQFWADTTFVPLDRAAWFADLLSRAEQATR